VRPIASGRPEHRVRAAHGRGLLERGPISARGARSNAYTVVLDEALRDKVDPIDVTPEGTQVVEAGAHARRGRARRSSSSYTDAPWERAREVTRASSTARTAGSRVR